MARKKQPQGVSWKDARLAPIVLIRSQEDLLADRAVGLLRAQAREVDPDVEITRISAPTYQAGYLATAVSPSLFLERRFIEILDLELLNNDLLRDLEAYILRPEPDTWLILRHNGGQRGKKLLDALAKNSIPTIVCPAIKYPGEKMDLVMEDVRRAHRRMNRDAAHALVDAVGDVSELAASVHQLMSDTNGTITKDIVDTYYARRVETTGFAVADAVVAGEKARSALLMRQAFTSGVEPLALIGALAMKLRNLAKVSGAASHGGEAHLGIAPWQIRKARQELRGWDEAGLAQAISALARADAEAKGESRDPYFAVEKAVYRIVECHKKNRHMQSL